MCRKYYFILLLLLFLWFVPNNVFATEVRIINGKKATKCTEFAEDINKNETLEAKYALKLSVKQREGVDDQYDAYVRMVRKNVASDYKKNTTKFKVTKIEFFEDKDAAVPTNETKIEGKTISYKEGENKLKLDIPEIKSKSKIAKYVVYLEPDGFTDAEVVKKCGKESTFEIFLSLEISGIINEYDDCDASAPGYDPSECPIRKSVKGSGISSTKLINCDNYEAKYTNKNSFNYLFCDARTKALASHNDKSTDPDGKEYTVKCDTKKYQYTDDYYVNKDYFFKSKVIPLDDKLVYKAFYTCGSSDGDILKTQQCNIRCEEAVTVEYGPPVASKAGLCFEYKVKVTSRVSCGMEGDIEPPVLEKMCTPSPVCTVPGSGVYHTQGGPNEEFDACIKACDGGKYTDKCSNKCYKKVYGTDSIKKTSGTELSYADMLDSDSEVKIEQLTADNSQKRPYDPKNPPLHKYYCNSKGNIIWNAGSGRNGGNRLSSADDSRWHKHFNFTQERYPCYSPSGIPRLCTCPETCTWVNGSCTSKKRSYMNPGEASQDYNANVDAYNSYIEKCEKAAECNSKESTYTINVKVNHSNESDIIYFPDGDILSANSSAPNKYDKLAYEGDKVTRTILSYNGCYSSDFDKTLKNIWYQSEWSFPGSWIHNKTGEISYKNKDEGWQKVKGKFCLPLDVKDVNQKWWNYYYTEYKAGKSNISVNTTEYKENCQNECSFKEVKEDEIRSNGGNGTVTDWNIEAVTRSFGHYEWNFNIKCFYAVNSNPTTITTTTSNSKVCTKNECTNTGTLSYRVRSVDLNNLFPDTEGSSTKSRTPGFNWSQQATNVLKNANYKNNPSLYAKTVQDNGNKIFADDSELDYHIELSRSKMQEIRKSLDDNKAFNNFDGDAEVNNETGIVHYSSKLIRNVIGGEKGVNFPIDSALKCNNIKDRDHCDNSSIVERGGN